MTRKLWRWSGNNSASKALATYVPSPLFSNNIHLLLEPSAGFPSTCLCDTGFYFPWRKLECNFNVRLLPFVASTGYRLIKMTQCEIQDDPDIWRYLGIGRVKQHYIWSHCWSAVVHPTAHLGPLIHSTWRRVVSPPKLVPKITVCYDQRIYHKREGRASVESGSGRNCVFWVWSAIEECAQCNSSSPRYQHSPLHRAQKVSRII